MADEKLPDYIESELIELMNRTCGCVSRHSGNGSEEHADLVAAIHRYAREREAAALERAAQVCDAKADVMEQNYRASINDEWIGFKTCYETAAERIRAMIHKEPANG